MRRLALALLLFPAVPLYAQQRLPAPERRVADIVRAVSARRVESDIRALVSFGTRHTLSDTLSPTRGIGAARRWIKAQFDSMSAACGGCLETHYVAEMIGPAPRVPTPTSVVSVVAVQRGQTDTGRVVIISGHFDSRVSSDANVTDSAPGANDDASGTVAVIEAARVLSGGGRRFGATIVYAVLAGEEQGLLGGQIVARWVRANGWRVEGVLNNDIVGNTRGADGANDDRTVRLFSDGVPPTETDAERSRRRSTGGEVDGISRQLARYVERIGRRYVPELDPWLIYRLDRFGRGGDHRAFADLGFPAMRITEAHEDWTRQHQDIRVVDGVQYGDLPDAVNFTYAARITALNAAALASLAWAPAPPRAVRISGGGRPSAVLSWQPPDDSAQVGGYRVFWRRTDAPTWNSWADVAAGATTHTFTNLVIDNYFFGVASLSREGSESTVVFPGPPPPRQAAPPARP